MTTDASIVAIGAILSQGRIGSDLPINYVSRTLNKTERTYNTTEKELLVIVWAIKMFRPYIYSTKFVIVTDHKPLTWLFGVKDPGARLLSWRLQLEEYVVYKPGTQNTNSDALSRVTITNLAEGVSTDSTQQPRSILVVETETNEYQAFMDEKQKGPIINKYVQEVAGKLT